VGVVLLTNTDGGEFIWHDNSLLRIYLKEAKNKKLELRYQEPTTNAQRLQGESVAEPGEIKGQYILNGALVNVTSTKKIKFKDEGIKVILQQKKGDRTRYTMKVVLLGFIPRKITDREFTFVKLKGEIYAKALYKINKKEEYLAVRTNPLAIPASWKEKFGDYKVTGTVFKCVDCPALVFDDLTMTLSEERGFIVMKPRNRTADLNRCYYLNIISEKLAVTGGIGRGTGETVRILDNGNIYYSGFEFTKKK
jgi:hypothetical protein